MLIAWLISIPLPFTYLVEPPPASWILPAEPAEASADQLGNTSLTCSAIHESNWFFIAVASVVFEENKSAEAAVLLRIFFEEAFKLVSEKS